MLPQIQKLTGVMRDDFLDAAYLLNSRKLFPDISEPDDMAKEARALKDNKANFEVIMELYNLFKEWEVLSLKVSKLILTFSSMLKTCEIPLKIFDSCSKQMH